MKEHVFGDVKVLEGETPGKREAIIRFPSMIGDVEKAEGFMINLIEGITKAREIIKDPI